MRRLLIASCTALGVGCSTPPVQPDTPALRVEPDADSRQEIEQVVSSALDGVPVTLADDALTRDSTLIIERGMRRRIDGPPELGRDLGRPQHFKLVIDARQCFLVHQETGLRYLLQTTRCAPE